MKTEELNTKEIGQVKILEPRLEMAIEKKSIKDAADVLAELEEALTPADNYNTLGHYKNMYAELALTLNKIDEAIKVLQSDREKCDSETPAYLEATALLAICYIRKLDLDNAKPLIKEALTDAKVITNIEKRKQFRYELIQRFEEETVFFGIKDQERKEFTDEELEEEIDRLANMEDEKEVYTALGQSLPEEIKEILSEVHQFALEQLEKEDLKVPPVSKDKTKDHETGATVLKSVKRLLYHTLCDPQSAIYTNWNKKVVDDIGKQEIKIAVLTTLSGAGIAYKSLSAAVIVLISHLNLNIYCEQNAPTGIMRVWN